MSDAREERRRLRKLVYGAYVHGGGHPLNDVIDAILANPDVVLRALNFRKEYEADWTYGYEKVRCEVFTRPVTKPREERWSMSDPSDVFKRVKAELDAERAAGHRYIYSTEDGDSCACGWRPDGFRMKDTAEWDAHVQASGSRRQRHE